MPRRPPPSALLLHTGPTPPRSHLKHYLPSIPQPIFYPTRAAPVTTQSYSRPRALSIDAPIIVGNGISQPPSPEPRTKNPLRGPWDHSRSLSESMVDVDSLVKPPKPAALTDSPLLSCVW